MLPFSKRKKADEIELEDADLVVLEDAPVEIDVAELEAVELEAAEADIIDERPQLPRVSSPPKASLRGLSTPRDQFEEDVANECLESIAEATSRVVGVVRRPSLSDAFPASIVPPSPHLPRFDTSVDDLLAETPLPQFELSDTDETTRRPALSSSSSMPIARDSVPGVLPSAPMSVSSLPTPVFSRTTSSPNLPAASSIAPVAMNSSPSAVGHVDPTVILVRQPPRAAWVVAAAFLGAACALLGMRLLTQKADAPQTIVLTAPPPPATTQAPVAAGQPAAPPATVRFNDEQAVAVVAAPTTTVSAAPKPVVTTASMKAPTPTVSKPSSLGPKLPDGSMALTKAAGPASAAPAPAPSPAARAPEKNEKPEPAAAPAASPTQKRKLTPEQELAEAQLKASMK